MANKDGTVSYTAAELRKLKSATDWAKSDAMTEAELEASIAGDPDEAGIEADWTQAVIGVPPRKEHVNLRIDGDILAWFRNSGRGYQTRMNNVLRAFVTAHEHKPR
jgi:uncharacterized protein (DUF4415 family)